MSTPENRPAAPVAIVTGAADGLGLAIATRLLRDGYRVVASDINQPPPELTEQWGDDRLSAVIVDAADPESGTTLVDLATSEFGRLDAVVNNAGIGGPGVLLENLRIDDLRQVFDVNILGTVRLCQAAIPPFRAQGSGSIVNLSSLYVDEPVAEGSAYCMSKAAIKTLTQCLALELGSDGIRVNAVAPGYMLTKMHLDEIALQAARAGVTAEEHQKTLRDSVPLRRHGTGDDVGSVVSWLLSDESSYLTGQTLGINGGISFN